MRAREFVAEQHRGRMRSVAHRAMPGSWRFRDSGIDRAYNLNRVMMAAACADGRSTRPVDMDSSAWNDRYNTAHPYTEAEHRMMRQAFGAVDTEYEHTVADHGSREHPGVNKTSPMKAFQGYPR
jgi:hypothetical protein